METIGSSEIQAQLPQILLRVAEGEEFTITEQGKPVAILVPARSADDRSKPPAEGLSVPPRSAEERAKIQAAIDEMLEFRKGNTLGPGITIQDLIEEGRRF